MSDSRYRRGRRTTEPDPDRDLGPEADPESVARKILLDQLTGRARTRAELAKKLAQRNVPGEVAQRLLDRFTEVGLIDDAAFARDWIEERRAGRGLARRALAVELRRLGVAEEVAKEALDAAAAENPEAELAAARMLVRRKLGSLRDADRTKATRRLVAMLARKGHSPGLAYRVVREELGTDEVTDWLP